MRLYNLRAYISLNRPYFLMLFCEKKVSIKPNFLKVLSMAVKTDGRKEERTERQMEGWSSRQTDERTDGRTDDRDTGTLLEK